MRHLSDVESQIDVSFKRRLREAVSGEVSDWLAVDLDRLLEGDLFQALDTLNQGAPGVALRFGLSRGVLDLGLLGFTVLSCRDVGQALEVMYRYHGLTSNAYKVHLGSVGDRVRLAATVTPASLRHKTVIAEEFVTGFWVVLSELLPGAATDMRRVDIRLDYPDPSYASLYAELMPCSIDFDGDSISLSFPAEWSNLPLETADATVSAVCRAQCDELLETVGSAGGVAEEVKRLILSVPSNQRPSLHEVARRMMMSPRTLERRLQEQGVSFRQIESEVRMGLAAQYVLLGSISGKQVASLLGYSNPSAFYRAFKTWHGQTPAEYQQSATQPSR